jgi:hypothetical protein
LLGLGIFLLSLVVHQRQVMAQDTASTSTVIYDATADFDASLAPPGAGGTNPNGVWTYGETAGLFGVLVPFPDLLEPAGINCSVDNMWLDFSNHVGGTPSVAKTSGACFDGNVEFGAGQLILHGGTPDRYAHVVFTAPSTLACTVSATFIARQYEVSADVYILSDGAAIFSDLLVGGPGTSKTHKAVLTLVAGDTVRFAVGLGAPPQDRHPGYVELQAVLDCVDTSPTQEARIAMTKTVGLEPDVCSETSTLTVERGTPVYYCYTVQNTGAITLTRHFINDSHLGSRSFASDLPPGETLNTMDLGMTFRATPQVTTTNTASWAARPLNYQTAIATAQATVLVIPQCVAGRVVYVDVDATGANTGASWADAFTSLQAALAVTGSGEIWVAEGIYTPTSDTDRTASFALKNCVALYGGFAGGETERDQRDWVAHPAILSGELGGGNFSYHVVTSRDTDATAILDGFTVTRSGGEDCEDFIGPCPEESLGAGLYNANGSPTLANLVIANNGLSSEGGRGGGLYSAAGNPTLTQVAFVENQIFNGIGGGMYIAAGNPTLTHVTFILNGGLDSSGGGLFVEQGSPTLTDVTFTDNFAAGAGALANVNGILTMTNITFTRNSGEFFAGAVSNGGELVLTNGRFINNGGHTGGGMANHGRVVLTNVAFAGNIALAIWEGDGQGGGLHNGGSAVLNNVTFSGNSAANVGGGIYNSGSISATNVTVANNHAQNEFKDLGGGVDGGGVYVTAGTFALANSILVSNTVGFPKMPNECGGTITSGGYNLIGDTTNCTITGDATGNLTGVAALLGPLQDNGGSTLTRALLSGSPAIDAGNPAVPGSGDATCAAIDQRGVVRPQDGNSDGTARCDMGAYEREPGTLDGPTGGQGQEQGHHLHLPFLNRR